MEDAIRKAAATYNSAADHYDDAANSFWERFGRETVARLRLPPGSQVLDVCCGSGASALPAAEIVGHDGSVLGVDLARSLVEKARAKATARGLMNVEFRTGNMLDLGLADASFDAVVCVFGIFFVPDMEAAVRELHRLVKSGGVLAITTWGPRFFEPATTEFWRSIQAVRPDLYKGFNPWDRISQPETLRALLESAGVQDATVTAHSYAHPIEGPEAWWSAVLGSGYRGTIDQLRAGELASVKKANFDYIRASGLKEVEANVIYVVAR